MDAIQSRTDTLRQVVLASEKRRTIGVVGFIVLLACAYAARILLYGTPAKWVLVLVVFLLLAAFEVVVYQRAVHLIQSGRGIPSRLSIFCILAETCVPAVGIVCLSPAVDAAYRPIATPWVLVFFPFVMLSTLRLDPWLCRFAGAIAMCFYLVSAYYVGWHAGLVHSGAYSFQQSAVLFYAAILLASGLVSGAVATEIKKHIEAALREAEVREQLNQVQREMQIASSIQQSLLPSTPPQINGFEIAGWNHSADDTGGDYFDWKQFPDGRLVVTLADVSGHGIGPALLASVCRAYSRSCFGRHDGLLTTLQRINDALREDLPPGRFATFVAAVFDQRAGTLELLSAGHGPLFVYSSHAGTFTEIKPQALPLGLMPQLNSDDPAVLRMEMGDLLLLITDGFFEWENAAGEEFGKQRVMDCIRRTHHLGPNEVIAELYRDVLAFADGSVQRDDLTAVLIKRTAVAPDVEHSLCAPNEAVTVDA